MNKSTRLHAAVLALAAITPVAALAGPPLPFTATLRTQETLGLDPGRCTSAPFLQGTTAGSGVASYLGAISGTSTDCISPADGSYNFSNGHMVLTAANGDTLTADYSGSMLPTVNYPVFSLSGSYRITGGTGRYVGATGTGTLQGATNIVSGAGAYTLTGQIAIAR
ncbi:MAG: hypothetical protein JSR59_22325 [Proteobacteria bacterium]|nr:hypothetical protein [Pseudomonadota bacterium]